MRHITSRSNYSNALAFAFGLAALLASTKSFAGSVCNPSEAQGGYCNLLGTAYDTVKNSSVLVTNFTGNGSATIILKRGNKYTVITAKHVISGIAKEEYRDLPLVTHDGINHSIIEIREEKNTDLAEIDFESPNYYPVAVIGESSYRDNDKVALAGYPMIRRDENATALCQKYSMGCWNRLFITKADAIRLELNPEFYPDKIKPVNLDERFTLSFQSNTGHDSCNIFDFSQVSAVTSGYNMTYNCVSYPGMSGGGVWRERDGKLIGVHGLGLGIRTTKNGIAAVYKAGLNMAISLSPRSKPITSSLPLTSSTKISNHYAMQNARFLLEKGEAVQSSVAFQKIANSTENTQLEKFGATVNRTISLILQGDFAGATKLSDQTDAMLARLAIKPSDSLYSIYLTARDSFLLVKQVLALASGNYRILDKATYLLEQSAIESGGSEPPLSRNFARLNYLSGQILASKDWQTGTPRSGFNILEPSYLGFNSPNSELTALYKLESWLKAIEINKRYEPFGRWTTKEMACRKLAAALMKSYFKDPLEEYIDNAINSPAQAYCLGAGPNDFIKKEDVLPLFLMFAL